MTGLEFFAELKRRNVYKIAITYAVVAWLLIQAASIPLPTFEAPAWVMKALVVFVGVGFVISVMVSWAFEATPEGLKRTENVSPELAATLPTWSRRNFATFVVGVAVIAAGLFAYQFLRLTGHSHMQGGAPATPHNQSLAGIQPIIPHKSIAVLPFENLSDEKANAYFTEGVQDEILTRLAEVADLGNSIGPIRIDPLLTSLHGDPRFEALAEKIVPARDFAGTVTAKK